MADEEYSTWEAERGHYEYDGDGSSKVDFTDISKISLDLSKAATVWTSARVSKERVDRIGYDTG